MLNEDQLKKFDQDGFLIIKDFLTKEKCQQLKTEIDKVIETNNFLEQIKTISVFLADENSTKAADEYFLSSVDKIRPFLEGRAKEILEKNDKSVKIFNKIGHALHALNPVFKETTFDNQVKEIFKSFGYKKPIVCQSMYIFKQPFIGGEVMPHQDGSYLYTEPLKVTGIWIALEDCTNENGCLEFIPGSHKGPLVTRFIRNPNDEEYNAGKFLGYTNGVPKFSYDNSKFISAEVKAGDAILIDGLVVHRSAPNLSAKSRNIYTFHVYDADGTEFSKQNW
ncbi:phytanoyl- dioxygenase domain-containing 1 isoform X1 [Brachionus plicatilis]|uniref:Phytanoyl-dioxygenase domain-containing 1 isoform X1 n=1 Tax=Brachionus plicatilis TaxID=10195 RepID=A0A3M7R8W3_BRAPC|nr:phytanoyl- dioxygenase domain-containing 1 isoform X1 [Brachionus plicatilis]